jgi:hypothetical protein
MVAVPLWIIQTENIKTKNSSSSSNNFTSIMLLPNFNGRTISSHDFFYYPTIHATTITQIIPAHQKNLALPPFLDFNNLWQLVISKIPILIVFALAILCCIVIISFGFNIIFYSGVMPWILYPISKLCVYHRLVSEDIPNGETFQQKILKMFIINLVLTIPIVLSLIYILNPLSISPSQTSPLSGFDICLIVAFAVTPGFLVVLRLMANPTRREMSFWKNHIIIKRKFVGLESDIKKVKDSISSFLGVMIFLTALYYFLEFCANYFVNGSYSTFFKPYATTMPQFLLVIWIVTYFGALYAITTIGEIILLGCEPIVQE